MPSKAKFSDKVKRLIHERDNWLCVLCWSNQSIVAHHVYFWDQSIRDSTRNNLEMWVCICPVCHAWKDSEWEQGCHWCSVWEGKRQRAIDYIINIYDR